MVNKKSVWIFITIILTVLAGCSDKQLVEHIYTFRGESENWVGEYKVNGTVTRSNEDGILRYRMYSNNILILTYKGSIETILEIDELSYSYQTSRSRSGGAGTLTNPTQKQINHKSGGSGGIVREDEIIAVSIEIGGLTESFELTTTQE